MTLAEISDIWGLNFGVNSTIFMELQSAQVVIDMMKILCQRIITGEEEKNWTLPRSGGDLRK